MNKIKYIVVLLLMVLVVGCSNNNDSKKVCTRNITDKNTGMEVKLNYTIYYKGKYVTRTESVEKITATSSVLLLQYQASYQQAFKPYDDIKYYYTDITLNGNTLTTKMNIDYTKVDYKKILEIEGDKGNIFTDDGKVELDTLVKLYESTGSECD